MSSKSISLSSGIALHQNLVQFWQHPNGFILFSETITHADGLTFLKISRLLL